MIKKRNITYFYKITNFINNHFYYGIHNTNDLNESYNNLKTGNQLQQIII